MLQDREQPFSKQCRPKNMCSQGKFMAIHGFESFWWHNSGIVDENIELTLALFSSHEISGEAFDAFGTGNIALLDSQVGNYPGTAQFG